MPGGGCRHERAGGGPLEAGRPMGLLRGAYLAFSGNRLEVGTKITEAGSLILIKPWPLGQIVTGVGPPGLNKKWMSDFSTSDLQPARFLGWYRRLWAFSLLLHMIRPFYIQPLSS